MRSRARYRSTSAGSEGIVLRGLMLFAVAIYPLALYFLTALALPLGIILFVLYSRRFFHEKDHRWGPVLTGPPALPSFTARLIVSVSLAGGSAWS
jgi:hypothetical protein